MASRRPRPAFATVIETPISGVNTTPLIDVMLVLLIMFILAIPPMTHSVKIDLPQGPANEVPAEPETHELRMDAAGTLRWDGRPVSEAEAAGLVGAFRRRDPEGLLRFGAEAQARYEDFDRILAAIKRAGVRRLAFVGNEGHAAALDR